MYKIVCVTVLKEHSQRFEEMVQNIDNSSKSVEKYLYEGDISSS
jgi:hypothetical protein